VRLLVVDDSLIMRKMVLRALRLAAIEFDEILEAGDGFEALQLVGRNPPELIICDVHMPRLDGLKFTGTIRKTYPSERVKIIILTSKASAENRDLAKKVGADMFLTKPFSPEDLARSVSDLLQHG
jgi:two-component system chemotaxis response regulator CheY